MHRAILWDSEAGQESGRVSVNDRRLGWIYYDVDADAFEYPQVYCLCMFDWNDPTEKFGAGLALVKVQNKQIFLLSNRIPRLAVYGVVRRL